MQSVCDAWNVDNPDVQVEAIWIGAGNSGGYAKMFAALAAGGGGDIAQVEFQLLPSFLLQNGLVDLSRYGFRDHLDSFRPADISRVSVGDSVFGVPQDTGPMGLFYRRDVFEEIGITPPATWAEWLDVARAVKASDPVRRLEGFNVNDPGNFTSYCMQAGAEWFKTDGEEWLVDLTGEPTRMVAQFMDQAFGEDLFDLSLGAFTAGWYAATAKGQIPSVITGSWGDALVESVGGTEGKWAVAPMPRWPDTGFASATLGGSTAAVMSTSKHPKEALDFILWMATTPTAIDLLIDNSGIGWSPSPDFIGTKREQPSAFFSGQNYNEEVFVPAAGEQNPGWIWSPIYLELNDALSTAVRGATSGGTPLVDAVADVQDRVIDIMQHKGLRVRSAS
nr:extracellular solute-binding protein [Kineococcus siccus]